MALFVDGPACTIDDLTDQDSGLLDVAQSNCINVTTKLRLAQEEIQTELQLWLLKTRPAVAWPGSPSLRIGQVVVTPPLKRWESMHALELVYRDAYFSQLVNRYQAKWQEYIKLSRDVRESFIDSGMGIVSDPLSQASPPALTTIQGPQTGGTFYARVAWVNARGQEGAASAASSRAVPDGNVMVVTPMAFSANAVGYRVYAGPALEGLALQNPIVLPLDVPYTYVPGTIHSGVLPGTGQSPDYLRPLTRTWLRG